MQVPVRGILRRPGLAIVTQSALLKIRVTAVNPCTPYRTYDSVTHLSPTGAKICNSVQSCAKCYSS